MRFRDANEVIGRIKTPDDGYRALCAAVIAVACDDYLRYRQLHDTMRVQTLERFFLSERFMMFSNGLEGSYILRKLKEMSEDCGRDSKLAKPCSAYDKHGNLVANYKSTADAARAIRGDRRSISRACNIGALCYEFYWRWGNEEQDTGNDA